MSCLILNGNGTALTPDQLLDKLLQGQNINLAESRPVWSISNKYYSAEVRLEMFKKSGDTFVSSNEPSNEKRHKVGASLFFVETFNGSDESLKLLQDWQKFVTQKMNGSIETKDDHDEAEDGPEVQLIVVEKFVSEDVKTEAFQLAVKLGAEIIDFSEADEDENEDDVSVRPNTSHQLRAQARH